MTSTRDQLLPGVLLPLLLPAFLLASIGCSTELTSAERQAWEKYADETCAWEKVKPLTECKGGTEPPLAKGVQDYSEADQALIRKMEQRASACLSACMTTYTEQNRKK